jgi:hypothetical protein
MVEGWVTFGILAFIVGFLAFVVWWREKIIELDNERLRLRVRRACHQKFSGRGILSFK